MPCLTRRTKPTTKKSRKPRAGTAARAPAPDGRAAGCHTASRPRGGTRRSRWSACATTACRTSSWSRSSWARASGGAMFWTTSADRARSRPRCRRRSTRSHGQHALPGPRGPIPLGDRQHVRRGRREKEEAPRARHRAREAGGLVPEAAPAARPGEARAEGARPPGGARGHRQEEPGATGRGRRSRRRRLRRRAPRTRLPTGARTCSRICPASTLGKKSWPSRGKRSRAAIIRTRKKPTVVKGLVRAHARLLR